MTSSASTTLASLLSRFPAFSQLDDQTLAWLASRPVLSRQHWPGDPET